MTGCVTVRDGEEKQQECVEGELILSSCQAPLKQVTTTLYYKFKSKIVL